LSDVYVNQTNLNVKLSTKVGRPNYGASQKSGGVVHPAPLKISTDTMNRMIHIACIKMTATR